MENQGSIGIFDSGIGGVTVLKEIIKLLPNEDYIYVSDSKNNPYGDKTDEEIIKRCDEISSFLINKNCKAIVIACNTASAKASKFLRNKYKEIPIIAIEPAYKMVHDYAYDKETLIMATKGTIKSERFKYILQEYNNKKTYIMPCVGLADLIEEGKEKKIKRYLEENLKEYAGKVKNVVLGCTHYPLIKNEISYFLGDVNFFDGALYVAKHLKRILEKREIIEKESKKGKIEFWDTKNSDNKRKRFFEILGEVNE